MIQSYPGSACSTPGDGGVRSNPATSADGDDPHRVPVARTSGVGLRCQPRAQRGLLRTSRLFSEEEGIRPRAV